MKEKEELKKNQKGKCPSMGNDKSLEDKIDHLELTLKTI